MTEDTGGYLRPRTIERVFGHVLAWLVRLGVVRGHFYVLEVRGRKSGRTISLPVDVLDLEARRYLVCARGNSNWVRNARAAGEVMLVRAMRRQRYAVREVPIAMRPALLKGYLDRYAREVQRFFPVATGSPIEAFEDLAPRYPVFELLAGAQSPPPARGGGELGTCRASCQAPAKHLAKHLASGSLIAHSKHSCSARRSRKSANAADRPLVARESRNVRRRRMDRAVSWITARGLPIVHLRGMPLHLFRARS